MTPITPNAIHAARAVAKAVMGAASRKGTPRRLASGTVVSALTGTAQIYLDGNTTTAIPAFVPAGLTLAAGNVVAVEIVANKAWITQRYS